MLFNSTSPAISDGVPPKPGLDPEVQIALDRLARRSLERLGLMIDSEDPKVALPAIKEVWDRLHGRPDSGRFQSGEINSMVVVIRENPDNSTTTQGPNHD